MSGKIKSAGVLGLGIIGSRVAENLRKAGFDTFVWSRTARAVPNFMASPREVAEVAEAVQIFVRDGEALIEAVREMAPVLGPDHIVMNHATVSPQATRTAAEICAKAGAGFLDAPFTGSKLAAQNGKMVYYVSGDESLLERARPVLEASSVKVMHLGRMGDATVLKIVTNLVTAATVEALAEAVAITRAAGIPAEKLLEAIEPNANCSPLAVMKLPAMIGRNYEPHFSLRNMLKDMRFAAELARGSGISAPVLDSTVAALSQAMELGKGDDDFSVIAENPGLAAASKTDS